MSKFLPTKDFHVLEITSLSPNEIKQSIKQCKKDRKIFKTTSALNFVAKHFGIKKGFSDYQRWYDEELQVFLKENNLLELVNLVDNPKKYETFFSYRKISDRLYHSKKILPKRIFTGCYSNIFFSEDVSESLVDMSIHGWGEIGSYDSVCVEKSQQFYSLKHLIGDVFIDYETFVNDEYIYHLYNTSSNSEEEKENDKNAKEIKEVLLTYSDDWVEIIPFYNLYFLKGKDSKYDFVFKNLRDETFDTKHNPFYPYLKHADVPSSFHEKYDFERWLYFGHKNKTNNLKNIKIESLWKEHDEHEAEKLFYENYSLEEYSQHNIYKDYYIDKKLYEYRNTSKNKHLEGFTKIVKDREELYISNIITIKEFEEFLEENKNYLESRNNELDKYLPLNQEDKYFPVTVTWFDAVAYCKWIEKKYDIPVRLLTAKEFLQICPPHTEIIRSFDNDVKFNEMTCIKSKENISFYISPNFGEFLFQQNHIYLPYFLNGIHGKHIWDVSQCQRKKIGFRICYTVKKDV